MADRSDDSPGSWREYERVDEPYREPSDSELDPFDVGPDVPEPPDPTDNDVDPELARRFWALVLVFNVALLAIALGAMFAIFEADLVLGGQLLVAGLAVFAFGVYRYRTTRRRFFADENDDENGDIDQSGDATESVNIGRDCDEETDVADGSDPGDDQYDRDDPTE